MGLRFILASMLISAPAFAQESTSTISIPKPATSVYAPHKNFVEAFTAAGDRTSFALGYSRALTSRILVGTTGYLGAEHTSSQSSGDLDKAQYYSDSFIDSTNRLELNSTFFFRENGYARWGFFVKAGVGHAWSKAKAEWKRYDRDPAWFHFGSDDKRLRESSRTDREWESTYGRLGIYYQMTFNFHPTSPVGHVLHFGFNSVQMDQKNKSVGYTKPNGESYSKTAPDSLAEVEAGYTLTF